MSVYDKLIWQIESECFKLAARDQVLDHQLAGLLVDRQFNANIFQERSLGTQELEWKRQLSALLF
jgi:hypothetical protein